MSKKETPKIIKILRIVMPIVGLITMIIFVPWDLVRAYITPLPNTVQEQVEEALKYQMEGIIVYVDKAEEEAQFYTAGWKDRDKKIPADPQSFFKIASISKLYIAVSMVKLAHSDSLSLDEKLTDYFPELKDRIENAEEITLRQMIQHRSGIPNLTDHPDYPWGNEPQTAEEVLEWALDLPADFKPGEGYRYSNTNYFLLSQVIDKVTGAPHFEYIKQEILDPLGLKNTFGSNLDIDPDDLMSGYYIGYEEDFKLSDDGSMLATAEDVGIFIRALNDGSILTEEENATYAQVYEYEHTGWHHPGYMSIASYHKEMDTVVIQFINTSYNEEFFALGRIINGKIIKILRNQ